MSITVQLTNDELAQIRSITKLDDDGEAVGRAAKEFIRLYRLRELKQASGKVEFEENWQTLESLELNESGPPQ